ncbi:formate/nitrite transporter family protein [Cellulomonas uda]|uniref:Nitrite transporter NirC n=1 Tax=Cellulomonas uda TaxID=1714 RepID=A0A4Y3KBG6_CELUD|nr:formate/nitrite transporter family protein [Cellulomonas uda]NII67896.1 nitrite transporter NirC [Cellulomonas uda]GEA80355.1 nitrite transporter NirC [Cellulomonas uda]
MLSIEEAVETQVEAAHHKVRLLSTPWLFAVRTMLAGAYIGIGVVIMVEAGGPLVAAGNPFAPLVQGMVFGVALTIVVVAGGELATSAMMMLTQGAMRRRITWGMGGLTLLAVLAGNLLGSILFAALVHVSGVTAPDTAAGQQIARMVEHKAHETNAQLLVRGILCNLLVCLAVWCATRLRSEAAKIAAIFACVMVFITSGFEHVVANMTTMSLGLMGGLPGATVAEFARNVLFVGVGNTIGGALLVGAAYAYRATPRVAEPGFVATTSASDGGPTAPLPAAASADEPLDEPLDGSVDTPVVAPARAAQGQEPALR